MKYVRETIEDQRRRIEFEKRERWAMEQIATVIRAKHPQFNYEWHFSAIDSGSPYDAVLYIKDIAGQIRAKYLVEVKNRAEVWDGYYLEAKKLRAMKQANKDNGGAFGLLYINFTPEGTYIWDLNDTPLKRAGKESMNKKTYASTEDKKNKSVHRVYPADAIHIDYVFDEMTYQASFIKPKKAEQPKKKVYSLF